MAKSTRSKVKRSFRSVKRTTGVYAAAEAARLNRLHAKLSQVASRSEQPQKDDEGEMDDLPAEETNGESLPEADTMQVDSESSTKKISTHGPRGSRREEWRKSKGLDPRPTSVGMNRQGGLAARRKAGRSKRRR